MFLFSLILALAPGFVWLMFYLGEDSHPEPKRLIALGFGAGIIAALFAIGVELIFRRALGGIGIGEFSVIALLIFAFTEEFLKFGAAYFAINKDPRFTEPIDAMIYAIVAALGFATLENIGTIAAMPQHTAFIAAIFQTLSLRFVGATLLHSLASGAVGYYWAKGIIRGTPARFIAFGLVIATVLHAVFNYLILNYESIAYSIIFLAVVGLFVIVDFEKLKEKPINLIAAEE